MPTVITRYSILVLCLACQTARTVFDRNIPIPYRDQLRLHMKDNKNAQLDYLIKKGHIESDDIISIALRFGRSDLIHDALQKEQINPRSTSRNDNSGSTQKIYLYPKLSLGPCDRICRDILRLSEDISFKEDGKKYAHDNTAYAPIEVNPRPPDFKTVDTEGSDSLLICIRYNTYPTERNHFIALASYIGMRALIAQGMPIPSNMIVLKHKTSTSTPGLKIIEYNDTTRTYYIVFDVKESTFKRSLVNIANMVNNGTYLAYEGEDSIRNRHDAITAIMIALGHRYYEHARAYMQCVSHIYNTPKRSSIFAHTLLHALHLQATQGHTDALEEIIKELSNQVDIKNMLTIARNQKDHNTLAAPTFAHILEQYYDNCHSVDARLEPETHPQEHFRQIYHICTSQYSDDIVSEMMQRVKQHRATPLEMAYVFRHHRNSIYDYRNNGEDALTCIAQAPAHARFVQHVLEMHLQYTPQHKRKQYIYKALRKANTCNNCDFIYMFQRYRQYAAIRKMFTARGYDVPELVDLICQYLQGPSDIPYWRVVNQPPDTYYCLQRHPCHNAILTAGRT